MNSEIPEDIDILINNEKRALVEECFLEVWTELTEEGIDPAVIAEIFVEAALKRLVREKGNEHASRLLAHFRELDEMGFLPPTRTLQ